MESVSFTQVGVVLGVLVVLLGAVFLVMAVFRRDPPLHREFVSRGEHEQLVARVDKVEERIDENFRVLNKNRSDSIAGLHRKIEETTDKIRSEVKSDNAGLHDRITQILAAFSKLQGAVATAMKSDSNHPFGS